MSSTYSLSVNGATSLDRPVAKIEPHAGSLIVSGPGIDPVTVDTEEIFDAEGAAGLRVSSAEGSVFEVTYADDVEPKPKAVRGDAGGTTGSFESRTTEELYELAQERKIKGRSSMSKDELIEALRA